jgi:hypothetical protein
MATILGGHAAVRCAQLRLEHADRSQVRKPFFVRARSLHAAQSLPNACMKAGPRRPAQPTSKVRSG